MLSGLGIIIIVVSWITVFVGAWKKRFSLSMAIALIFVGILVGLVVANLNDVVGLVIKNGDKNAYSLQLDVQRVKNAAQKAETDANAIREIRGRVEEFVKRVEKSEQTASQMGSAIQETDKILKGVQQQQTPRRLSDEQKQVLVNALSPFQGQKVSLQCVSADHEGCQFAKDFNEVFVKARWDFGDAPGVSKSSYRTDPIGIKIYVSENEVKAGRIPQGMEVLADTLIGIGLLKKKESFTDPNTPVGEIQFVVGRKP